MNAHPEFPDSFHPSDKPQIKQASGSLTRIWQVQADPKRLAGIVFGMEGLLGSSQNVRFSLKTLDGRIYEATLLPTQSSFRVPAPPSPFEIAFAALDEGIRRAIKHPATWCLVLFLLACNYSRLATAASITAYGVTIGIGHWLTTPITPVPLLLTASSAPIALMLTLSVARAKNTVSPAWVVLLLASLTGLLSGCTGALLFPQNGLSQSEIQFSAIIQIGGWLLGAFGLFTTFFLIRDLAGTRLRHHAQQALPVFALAWCFYVSAGILNSYGAMLLDLFQLKYQQAEQFWLTPFINDWTLGRIRLPVASLTLIVLAIALWPRQRRFQSATRKTRLHWSLVLAAVLAVPLGTLRIHNPWHSSQPPSVQTAEPLIGSLLNATYRAFNLSKEDEAFDRLEENLAGELVADVYLDSRRRLTEGTRSGATVTVKQVELLSIEATDTPQSGTYTYRCAWVVTARVKHAQHIHDRKNAYVGEIAVAADSSGWKIIGLNLLSEERKLSPKQV